MSGSSRKNRYAATKERLGMVDPGPPSPPCVATGGVPHSGTDRAQPSCAVSVEVQQDVAGVPDSGTVVRVSGAANKPPTTGGGPHRWKKGESGNPAGRPALPEELKATINALTPKMLRIIEELADGAESESVRLEAARYLTDRRLGKPVEVTKMDVTEGQPGYRIRVEPLVPEADTVPHPTGGTVN